MKHGLSLLSPFSRNAQQTSVNTALRCSGWEILCLKLRKKNSDYGKWLWCLKNYFWLQPKYGEIQTVRSTLIDVALLPLWDLLETWQRWPWEFRTLLHLDPIQKTLELSSSPCVSYESTQFSDHVCAQWICCGSVCCWRETGSCIIFFPTFHAGL